MITIDYDKDTQAAVIAADNTVSDPIWAEIRRVCEEQTQQIVRQSARYITIPWCNFLTLRANLRYVLTKHAISTEFSQKARELLLQTEERRAAYYSSTTLVVNTYEIQQRLNALGFKRLLTPEQVRNVARLLRFPAAAAFSVPGAGKTTEALAYFFLRREPDTRLLIVAPKNAFAAWEEQLEECIPTFSQSILRLQGGEVGVASTLAKKPIMALITYQQLCNTIPLIASFLSEHLCFMFLDESHRMKKGHAGVHGAAVLSLSHLPVCKLILSGTPMPNSLADLVPQFTFLYPMIQVKPDNIAKSIQNIYVRTTKSELGLVEPIRISRPVSMRTAQYRLYENLRSETVRQMEHLSSLDRTRLRSIGRSVIRLIQVAVEPALLEQSELSHHELLLDAIAEGPGPKILEACRIARELAKQGKKCVIWSQFVQIVEVIADMLADLGAVYIHGGVEVDEDEENTDSREAKIRKFHDDSTCMVIVANPAACSEGISLHRICHHAIYVDRNYNAAQYLQSEDRIHRLGMSPDENTFITILHCPSSIDDSVQRRLEVKVARMREVLNDQGLNIEPVRYDEEFGVDIEDLEDIRRILGGEESTCSELEFSTEPKSSYSSSIQPN